MKLSPSILGTMLLGLVLSACFSTANFQKQLAETFMHFHAIHFGKDYPNSEKVRDICLQKNIIPCQEIYLAVQKGKAFMQHAVVTQPDRVFDSITTTIEQYCPHARTQHDIYYQEQCVGAAMSLYFFTDEKFDLKIQVFLRQTSPVIAKTLLEIDYEWYHNRPHPQQWIELVRNLPEATITQKERAYALKIFENNNTADHKFGLML